MHAKVHPCASVQGACSTFLHNGYRKKKELPPMKTAPLRYHACLTVFLLELLHKLGQGFCGLHGQGIVGGSP